MDGSTAYPEELCLASYRKSFSAPKQAKYEREHDGDQCRSKRAETAVAVIGAFIRKVNMDSGGRHCTQHADHENGCKYKSHPRLMLIFAAH